MTEWPDTIRFVWIWIFFTKLKSIRKTRSKHGKSHLESETCIKFQQNCHSRKSRMVVQTRTNLPLRSSPPFLGKISVMCQGTFNLGDNETFRVSKLRMVIIRSENGIERRENGGTKPSTLKSALRNISPKCSLDYCWRNRIQGFQTRKQFVANSHSNLNGSQWRLDWELAPQGKTSDDRSLLPVRLFCLIWQTPFEWKYTGWNVF